MKLRHSCLMVAKHETSFTLRGEISGIQNTMKLRHSCLKVATHETSFTLRGAISGMQNTMKLRHSCLIVATHETSFAMRGATGVIFQHRRWLRLPRKVTVMIDPRHIWNVIYNARSNRCHPPTSPSTAPATKSDCHEWSSSHMKRYLQCAEQEVSSSNITDDCACHAKWLSWVFLVTYETLFTMRGATEVILQRHQILRLPRKVTVMSHEWSSSHVKRYLQCAEQQVSSSNITEYCACHAKWLSKISQKFLQNDPKRMKRHLQCATDPRMIRAWNRQSATRLVTEVTFRAHHERLLLKNTTFRAPAIIPNFTKCCTCHWKVKFEPHQIQKNCSHDWSSSHMKRFTMRGATGVIFQHHQILRLPRKVTVMIDPRHRWNVIYNARSKSFLRRI